MDAAHADLAFLYRQFLPVLIGWSTLSVGAAIIGLWLSSTAHMWRSFWFMSGLWAAVNIAIAITALVDPPATADAFAPLLAINIGLNGVWVASGVVLLIVRPKDARTNTMLNGFGLAILVQGAFLLALDTTFYVRLAG